MRDDSTSWSVTAVFASIVILAVTVAGVLFSDLYSKFTGSDQQQLAGDFDPSRYPSPSAGVSSKPKYALTCEGVIYRATKGGVKYVRQASGGVFIGAEHLNKFGFYKMEYGLLAPVDESTVDRFTKAKLKYALYNCEGPFERSGADF
jgi:hypothetical protein